MTKYPRPFCEHMYFETRHDLDEHLKAFGTDPKTHVMKVRKAYVEVEQKRRFV